MGPCPTIGSACKTTSACGAGYCNDASYCTKACTTVADCGTSPYGHPNGCALNGAGAVICFPGCSVDADCRVYAPDLYCQTESMVDGTYGQICVL